MTLVKFFSLTILLFVCFQICAGQTQLKAELADKTGKVTYEHLAAITDVFLQRLLQERDSTGYVLIYNEKVSDNRRRFRYEQWLKGHLRARRFDEKRIFIIRGEDRNEFQMQFWIVPKGAAKPEYAEAQWSAVLDPQTKPFIFATTEWNNGLDYPSEYSSLNLFSEYLEANPSARGHFVVRAESKSAFQKEKSEMTKLLVEKYKINSSRLKFFYVMSKKKDEDYPQVEVWLVPSKQNKKS